MILASETLGDGGSLVYGVVFCVRDPSSESRVISKLTGGVGLIYVKNIFTSRAGSLLDEKVAKYLRGRLGRWPVSNCFYAQTQHIRALAQPVTTRGSNHLRITRRSQFRIANKAEYRYQEIFLTSCRSRFYVSIPISISAMCSLWVTEYLRQGPEIENDFPRLQRGHMSASPVALLEGTRMMWFITPARCNREMGLTISACIARSGRIAIYVA